MRRLFILAAGQDIDLSAHVLVGQRTQTIRANAEWKLREREPL
jgi:hypothetical protein